MLHQSPTILPIRKINMIDIRHNLRNNHLFLDMFFNLKVILGDILCNFGRFEFAQHTGE